MSAERDRFLATVRKAVAEGNRTGGAPLHPDRGGVGWQGAGADPVGRFAAELAATGGTCHVVADRNAAVSTVLAIVREKEAKRVLVGSGPVIDTLDLQRQLRAAGIAVAGAGSGREDTFAGDLGITGVDYLVAETGSLALLT